MPTLTFSFETKTGATRRTIRIDQAVIAGWTGRDKAAVEKHIAELEKIGVKRPTSTPIYYRVAASRLTTESAIEVSGEQSSGEVEFVVVQDGGKLWVGVGSDHTDREVETYGVTVSKQMCDKPVAPMLWPYDEVAPHWDQLVLRARIAGGTLYQEGPVAAMLGPQTLIEGYGNMRDGTLMFCGTLGAIGGVRPSPSFEIELHDPVLARTIRHRYDIVSLPILG